MPRLVSFTNVSLDGYFTDASGDMGWAHKRSDDTEWNEFVAGNAGGGGTLIFGRVTYQLMASFWPTPMAMNSMPQVAKGMNEMPKIVFSRTLTSSTWQNTRVVNEDLVSEIQKLKREPGNDMAILGSGSIIAQLSEARLIDEYQLAVAPIALGAGRTVFAGLRRKLGLKLAKSRTFKNGNVLLCYEPLA